MVSQTLPCRLKRNIVILTSVRTPNNLCTYLQGKLMYKALYKGASQRNTLSLTKQALNTHEFLWLLWKKALETPYHSRIFMIIMKQ